jgi:putative nucleotidyltransferase with HDIG domain
MSGTARSSLSASGRALVGAVGFCGFAVLVHSVLGLASRPVPFQWLALSLMTFGAGTLTLKVPSIQVRLSVSEVFAFTCVLLYGPELGAITVVVDGLLLSWRHRMSRPQAIFNFGNLALSVWISGKLFFAVAGLPPLHDSDVVSDSLLLPLGVLTLSYFLLNSGLTAAVIGAESRRPARTVWREHFMGLLPTYAAGASVALLMVSALRQVHFGGLALIVPLVLISYMTMRSSFGRLEDSKRHVEKLNHLYLSTIETLATAIDAKDEVTHGHIRRVQRASVGLAHELGVKDDLALKAIEAAALLHDTGKLAVPEHILNKPGKLTAAEFEKMRLHAPIGADILSAIEFPYPVVPIVRHHHENWDGTGYPDGLRGMDIPLGARILSVVDCFDALTSDRPYRPRMADEQALRILRDRRGTMYDPLVVDAFVGCYQRIMPTQNPAHPAAVALGGARAAAWCNPAAEPPAPAADAPVLEELLGVASLARAVSGEATIGDVGALAWMMLRQVVPCGSMALYAPDERHDALVGRFAVGVHAALLRTLCTSPGNGIVGWVAANRRAAVNADAAVDFGYQQVSSLEPPIGACLAVPLVHEGSLAAVLCLYGAGRFTEDHARLLELLAPRLAASLASVTAPAPALDTRAELRLVKRPA